MLSLLVLLLTAAVAVASPHSLADALHGHDGSSRPSSSSSVSARPPPTGYTGIHDPSGAVWDDVSQAWYIWGTGLTSHVSTDGYSWKQGPQAPQPKDAAWLKMYMPEFGGGFWAPDVSLVNGLWHMFYAASMGHGPISCIGLATSPPLASPNWTDSGAPITCELWSWTGLPMWRTTINAIDPHLFVDPRTNRKYLSYGSFHAGIYIIELTGDPVVRDQIGDRVNVQRFTPPFMEGAEASWVQVSPSGAFWLFGNWGTCCVGTASTYNIRAGVSVNPMGPYYDRDGVDMRFNGGTVLLNVSGNQHGPGQIGFPNWGPAGSPGGNLSAPVVSYHYYDGNSNPPGAPTLGQATFHWDVHGWPAVTDRM